MFPLLLTVFVNSPKTSVFTMHDMSGSAEIGVKQTTIFFTKDGFSQETPIFWLFWENKEDFLNSMFEERWSWQSDKKEENAFKLRKRLNFNVLMIQMIFGLRALQKPTFWQRWPASLRKGKIYTFIKIVGIEFQVSSISCLFHDPHP